MFLECPNNEGLRRLACFMNISNKSLCIYNHHHPVASVLKNTILQVKRVGFDTRNPNLSFVVENIGKTFRYLGYECSERNAKKKLGCILEELSANNYYYIPQVIHDLFNKVFVGDFTPIGALLKLEWMFHDDRYYCEEDKKNLMDFLFFISSLEYKNTFTEREFLCLKELRNNNEDVKNVELLKMFYLEVSDIVAFLRLIIFHPYWGKEEYKNHFLILASMRTPKDLNRTNISLYADYSNNNGIEKILPSLNKVEVNTIKDYLRLGLW